MLDRAEANFLSCRIVIRLVTLIFGGASSHCTLDVVELYEVAIRVAPPSVASSVGNSELLLFVLLLEDSVDRLWI